MKKEDLDQYLSTRSYLNGYQYTYSDLALFTKLSNNLAHYDGCTNIKRWLNHVRALSTNRNTIISKSSTETKAVVFSNGKSVCQGLFF